MRFFVNMRLQTKLLISFGFVTFFLCLVVWTALSTIINVTRLHHAIYEQDVPVALDLMTLSQNMRRMRVAGQLMMLVDDTTVQDRQVQEFSDIEAEDNAIMNRLKVLFRYDASSKQLIQGIDVSLQTFHAMRVEHLNPLALEQKTDEEKVQLLKIARNRLKEMLALSEKLRDLPQKLAALHLKQSEKSTNEAIKYLACLGAGAIICSILMVAVLTHLIVEPVHALTLAAKRIEKGDLRVHFKHADRMDEFGVLSRAFAGMSEALLQRSNDLGKAMNEVKESNAQLQHFAYIAAHDLKEPLRTITSYLQLLAKRQQGKLDEKSEKYVKNSIGGATRMGELVDALLSYARVDTRAESLVQTNCAEIIEQVRRDLKVLLDEKHALVTYDSLPTVLGDQRQLTQLFQNLIQNALKFHGPERPTVHISATKKDLNWLISVKDNGIGMEMQFAERIFAIFQRLHTRDEYPGTGMGLSICKKIVERHGGEIWVESQPDNGAEFLFTIPDKVESIKPNRISGIHTDSAVVPYSVPSFPVKSERSA